MSVNRNQAFADAGFNMVVYTPIPTRGVSDEIRQEYKKRKLEKLFDDKMIVHRFALMREGSNSIKRAFRYVLNCIKLCCFGILPKMLVHVISCLFLVHLRYKVRWQALIRMSGKYLLFITFKIYFQILWWGLV